MSTRQSLVSICAFSVKQVQQLSIPELMTTINSQDFPKVRNVDEQMPYQVGVHPKLPKTARYLIHEAVSNGHLPLLRSIVNRNALSLTQKDSWSRTALHLMAIFDVDLNVLPNTPPQQVVEIKDGFGRTQADIRTWKQHRVQTSISHPLITWGVE